MVLKIKDGTQYEIGESQIGECKIHLSGIKEFVEVYNKMTDENLSIFDVTKDGNLVGHYENFSLAAATIEENHGVFNIVAIGTEKEPSIIEKTIPDDYSEAGRILMGEEE